MSQFGHRANPFEQPQTRSLRNRLVAGTVGLVLALCVLVLCNPTARRWAANPGPLSSVHAGLAGRCVACHAAADLPPSEYLATAAVSGDATNERCNACHDFGPDARLPHGVSSGTLAAWTVKARARPAVEAPLALGLANRLEGQRSEHQAVACATCHREHHGAGADLTAVANATCQACHQGPFHSLGRGHPEFSDYGAEQAGHLRFTHTAHLEAGGHFAESDQAAPDCRACHVLDADDAHALLRDNTFSRWCAECHSGREFGPLTLGALPPAPAAWLGLEDWPVAAEKDDALDPAAAEPTNFVRALLAPQALEGSAALRELVLRFQDYALDYIGVEEDWDGLVTEDMRLEAYEQEEADARAAEEAQLVDPARRYAEAVRALLRASASPRAFEALLAEAGFTPGPQTRALSEALPAAAEGAWRYEGYGHEDPFLTAWLELAETLPPGSPRLEALRDTVRGRCVVCHQLDEDAEGVVVRWDAAYSGAREQTATRFAHGPHLELPGITDCASCHALKAQPPAEEVESRASDFELVRFGERAVCATCHAPRRAAGDACVSCHDYHVGRIPRAHPVWDGDPARLGARAPKTPDEAH